MAHHEAIKTREYTYNVTFRPEPEGGYTALVPALSGCISYGENLDEARGNIAEAIEGYLESLALDGQPLPATEMQPQAELREPITVKFSTA